MKSFGKIIFNFYVLFWVLYNFHWQNVGIYFPLLDLCSNIFLGVNLFISIICTIIVISKKKLNTFFKILNILLFSIILYGLISILINEPIYIKAIGSGARIKNATYLISALRTFLPIYTCYLFTKMGCVNIRNLQIWFWVFLLQSLLIYFLIRNSYGLSSLNEMITNNSSYLFVTIFPLVSLFEKRLYIQYVLIVLLFALTVISLKRGAILIMSLEIIYFFKFKLNKASNLRRFGIIFSLFLLIVIGCFGIENLYNDNSAFQARIEKTIEGNVSGRDYIISNLLDTYLNSGFLNLLFGYGADSTLKIGVNYAHNDWIELLLNQGMLGFILFLLFWITFYRIWYMEVRKQSSVALLIGLLFICSFSKTFFSMWYSMANIYVTLPLGYCLANIITLKEARLPNYNLSE